MRFDLCGCLALQKLGIYSNSSNGLERLLRLETGENHIVVLLSPISMSCWPSKSMQLSQSESMALVPLFFAVWHRRVMHGPKSVNEFPSPFWIYTERHRKDASDL